MHLIPLSYLLSVKSVASGTSVNWYVLNTMSNVLFYSYIHPWKLWFSSSVIRCCYFLLLRNKTDYREKPKARCRLKTHAGSTSSLNCTLKCMFGFYHQLYYWFNTCLYMFNGEPGLSTIRVRRVTIKYRARICSQSTCTNTAIWIYLFVIDICISSVAGYGCVWTECTHFLLQICIGTADVSCTWTGGTTEAQLTQQSNRDSYCSGNALEMLWWKVRIINKYSPETHLHTGTHSKRTGLTQVPQIPGKWNQSDQRVLYPKRV